MPRGPRLDFPDALHHVIVRGIDRKYIFEDTADKERFLLYFSQALTKSGCACYAWCIMGNHAHFLIRSGDKGLAPLMRSVLTRYALYYNRTHHRSGHLFQNRYKSILIQEEAYFEELVRYIHLNPVRAKMVRGLRELAGYAWTGHAALVGRQNCPWLEREVVLERFGVTQRKAVARYVAFVGEGIRGKARNFSRGGLVASVGGTREARQLQQDGQRWAFDERVLGDGDFVLNATAEARRAMDIAGGLRLAGRTTEDLAEKIRKVFRLKGGFFLRHGKSDAVSRARAVYARLATGVLGLPRKVVAGRLGITRAAVGQAIFRTDEDARYKEWMLRCLEM